MRHLNAMIGMVLITAVLLLLNAAGLMMCRDHQFKCETDGEYILKQTLEYEKAVNTMMTNRTLYLLTNDSVYLDRLSNELSDFRKCLRLIASNRINDQVNTILSQEEQDAYDIFLVILEDTSSLFLSFDSSDGELLNEKISAGRSNLETAILSYMDRLERSRQSIRQTQTVLEVTMFFLLSLLLVSALSAFCFIGKENRWNSYFRKLYTTVVDNVNVGLSITDSNGNYEYMNAKYKEIFEIEGCDPIGSTPFDLFAEEVARPLASRLSDSPARTDGHLTLEINGTYKHMDYDHFVILDENKQKKYVDFLHDTTQTEAMQQKLKEQMNEIQFYSKAKDAFLANMSHELRTPVTAIVGITDLLQNTPLTDQQKGLLDKIEKSSEMLALLVNDILDLSKIKAHALKLYPTTFVLTEALQAAADIFMPQIEEKGLQWKCRFEFPEEMQVYCDRTRLMQVLINLISNAVKFTDQGHICLQVKLAGESRSHMDLEFCVEDTGLGISKKEISTLFQEFHQLENHLTKQHKGTGLGLSISKGIVDIMGGRMWVTSIKGAGSRFYFSLSLLKAKEKQEIAERSEGKTLSEMIQSSKLGADSTSGPVGGRVMARRRLNAERACILVTDDTDINREITVTLLETIGATCETAKDGLEAVNLCKNRPKDYYTLILMDIHMPNMNGFEASDILKNQVGVTAPIIALTATSADEKSELMHQNSIDDFVLKPFHAEDLYTALTPYITDENEEANMNADKIDEAKAETERKDDGTSGTKVSPLADPDDDGLGSDDTACDDPICENPFSGKEQAIFNLGGLEAIYYKHVAKFKNNYADAADLIRSYLDEQDFVEAKRYAHSIKGLAGTLGMDQLYHAASHLDKKIAEKNLDEISSAMDAFRQALTAVIDAEVS